MKKNISTIVLLMLCSVAFSQDLIYVNSGNISSGYHVSAFDSLSFNNDYTHGSVYSSGNIDLYSLGEIESITFEDNIKYVKIDYSGDKVKIVNPFASSGVKVQAIGADVIINSESSDEIEYRLSGAATDGSFKLYSSKKYILNLSGVNLTSKKGAPINIQSGKKGTVEIADGTVNSLTDSNTYQTVDGEDMKAAFFSEGQLIFTGEGTLNVTGNNRHAICSDDYIEIESGNINVLKAVTDGIHANDYITVKGGAISIISSSDGIDAGDGYYKQTGGTVDIVSTGADVKAIKCDSVMSISSGSINMTISGNQSKGLKSKQGMFISGGNISATCSGGAVVTAGDPSYCTAIKSDDNITISGGTIKVTHTGIAGKGISADGDIKITLGTIDIKTTGNGSIYTNASNTTDSYSSTCIKADGTINILGGNITTNSSGSAGKGIVSTGDMILGSSTTSPVVSATTSGSKFSVGSSSTGGGNRPGGGGPGGGGMNNGSYANPKAIKSNANLTVNSGKYTLKTSQDGGEGLESKKTLTINGGTIEAECYDDCLNASTSIVINDGKIYCYSTGNDGIDSNGTLTINGGIVISSGTTAPEEGFDCDNNTFKITGGILIGTGGATSNPTSSVCSQYAVKYTSSASANQVIYVNDSNGNTVLAYKIPRTYSSMTMLFSCPDIKSGTKYTIYKGGTITGSETFHSYYSGASCSGGSSSKSFTPTTGTMLCTAN